MTDKSAPRKSAHVSDQFFATPFEPGQLVGQIVDSTQDGIIALDRELRYVLWNPYMEQSTGLSRHEVFGKHPWDLFPILGEHKRMFERALAGETFTGPDLLIPVFKTGRSAWTSGRTAPIRDATGAIIGVLVMVRDITERKHAEEELRTTQQRFRSLIEHSHAAIVLMDAHGQKLYASPAVTRITGYEVEEFLQRPLFSATHPDDHKRVVDLFAAVVTNPDKLAQIELRLIHKDGSIRWIEAIGSNLLSIPGVNAVVTNMQDITERKQAEEERRKLEARIQHTQRLESLGVLAGGIAHDFNNLLVGILGNAELALLDVAVHSSARQRIEDIRKAGIRAAELTKQMLAYSGKGKFVVETINLNDVIKEMGHLLQASISKKAVLRYNLSSETPVIDADASQIGQVVMNLIINASEALGDADGTITLTSGLVDADANTIAEMVLKENLPEGRYAYLEVSDTGCGMDKETRAKIFDPFFTTKFTGRGLGLSAVIGIVHGHKGAIKVYSEPGKGTSIKILFPSSSRLAAPRRKSGFAAAVEGLRGHGLVLVIDDDEVLRGVIKESLLRFGFQVLTARDGREGIDIFRERAKDIAAVVLDMTMPHMNGEETFSELRRIQPSVRVLLTSGYNEQDATHRFAAKGLAGFIQKPFQLAVFIEKMCRIVEG